MSAPDRDIAQKDERFWNRPLTFDAKGLFLALGKGALHGVSQKWDDVAADALDGVAAVGLGREPCEVGGILISRAMRRAVFTLLRDFLHDFPRAEDARKIAAGKADKVAKEVEQELGSVTVKLDRDFLRHPAKIDLIPIVAEHLQQWLEAAKIENRSPQAIAGRLSSHFVYALHCEFREKPDFYAAVVQIIESPFTDALDYDRDWQAYRRWLEWKLDESLFGEAFSLRQIFQWPRAWYEERDPDEDRQRKRGRYSDGDDVEGVREQAVQLRHVVTLREELDAWLGKDGDAARRDAIRILRGDPGAGKSSFVRMFAQHRFEQGDWVLVVPLHLIDDPQADFSRELDKFCDEVPDRPTGLVNDQTAPEQLLLILDGLDELAKMGAAGAAVAQAFVEAVEKTVLRRNTEGVPSNDDGPRLRVLMSGRPLAVQSVSNSFREQGRVLEILPYWIPNDERSEGSENARKFRYTGQTELLNDDHDQRQAWWKTYGALCGEAFDGLPEPLQKFHEITSQPLHNFLLAMVYRSPGQASGLSGDEPEPAIDFNGDVSLNEIYGLLLRRVYERGWGEAAGHVATREIEFREFRRLFEEMALAAWHHRERVTTVKAVRERCATGRLKTVLDLYEEKFTDGVAQLFAAFYIRGSDRLIDNEKTFEFTHKSFGEYLTACRIVSALASIDSDLRRSDDGLDEGSEDPWDERKGLLAWLKICGPTAISFDLLQYLENEVAIVYGEDGGPERVESWRQTLARLINTVLRIGMPCERLQENLTFHDMQQRARQAETALLALHRCCAAALGAGSSENFQPTEIAWPKPGSLGTWLRQLLAQPLDWSRTMPCHCLLGLGFRDQTLIGAWLSGADLRGADLRGAHLGGADLRAATVSKAQLKSAVGEPARQP
jgi:hypothetical protein